MTGVLATGGCGVFEPVGEFAVVGCNDPISNNLYWLKTSNKQAKTPEQQSTAH